MNISQKLDRHLSTGNYLSFMLDLTRDYGSGFKPRFDVVDTDHEKCISGHGGTGEGILKESPDEKPTIQYNRRGETLLPCRLF